MSSWKEKEDADNVVEEKRFRAALFKERLRSGREYQFLEREKEKIKHAGRETRARKRRAMAIPRREARRRDSFSSVELSFSSLLGIHFCTYSLSHACPQSTCASCIPFTAHLSLSLRFSTNSIILSSFPDSLPSSPAFTNSEKAVSCRGKPTTEIP